MRQPRKTATRAAALAALTLMAACTDDGSASQDASPAAGGEPAAVAVTPAVDYTVLGATHLDGPGRWAVTAMGDPDAPMAVFDVPEGFQGRESWVWTDNQGPRRFAQLASWTPTRVPKDPCHPRASSSPLGPSVEAFAAALDAQEHTTTTTPIPVTMDGHDGLYVELTSPARFDYRACGPDGMQVWQTSESGFRELDEPVTDRYWIMDVDGHRVVISALTVRTAARETVELVTRVAETVAFVDPD